jgi:hypothetical protein
MKSCVILLTDTKFVLLHESKNDDGIKSFLVEVWELYVKVRTRVKVTEQNLMCFD